MKYLLLIASVTSLLIISGFVFSKPAFAECNGTSGTCCCQSGDDTCGYQGSSCSEADGGYYCDCGGGGSCNADNWGGCNVSCGSGTQWNECGDSRACWAGACCTNSNPAAPTLTGPQNGSINVNPAVTLTWQAPASWGNNCGGNSQSYIVYFDTSPNPTTPISCPAGSTTCTYFITNPPVANSGTTYYWKVVANNNGLLTSSAVWSLTYKYPNIVGLGGSGVWNATALGASCNQSDVYKGLNELNLPAGAITYSSLLPNAASATVFSYNKALPTYEVKNIAYGSGTLCVDTSSVTIPAGLSWNLACADVIDTTGASTANILGEQVDGKKCVLISAKDINIKLDLGLKLVPVHWFNSINGGDVFAGSVDLKVPATEDTTGGFKSYLVSGNGYVFGGGSVVVVDAVESTDRAAQNGGVSQNINGSFISNTSFVAPNSAVELSNCSTSLENLDPNKSYKILDTCLQTFLNSKDTYSLDKDGVAVVYVTGALGSKITFGTGGKAFKSSGSQKRILFILNGVGVEISSDLGYVSPTVASGLQIEAGIVSTENINFPSKGDANADTTVMLEGPIVSRKSIVNLRNRFLQNTYPSVAVKFNTVYLKYLKSQELFTAYQGGNYTGKTSYDVIWEY